MNNSWISNDNNLISELRPGQKITVGFMDITASEDAKIIKIEAEMIERIEAHSMIMDGEIMKMRKITPELIKNKKYKFKPEEIKESVLFEKKIFNKSKGALKLLDVGDLSIPITIDVSFASKKAIEKVEKSGGRVNLTKAL